MKFLDADLFVVHVKLNCMYMYSRFMFGPWFHSEDCSRFRGFESLGGSVGALGGRG